MVRFPTSWDEPYRPEYREHQPSRHETPARAARPPRDPDEVLTETLTAAQTPRQQELAGQIYSRLKGGADVADVKGLIEEMTQVTTRQARSMIGTPAQRPRGNGGTA